MIFLLQQMWNEVIAIFAGGLPDLSVRVAALEHLSLRGQRRKAGLVAFLVALLAGTQVFAQAFGYGFSSAYSFRSADQRAVAVGALDLMERKSSGFYDAPIYNVNNTTNVAGDQIFCDVSASSIGNTGSTLTEGQSGAPSVLNSPDVTADAAGNRTGDGAVGPLNAGDGGANRVATTQGVEGSSQTSTVGSTTFGGVTGDVAGSQSSLSQTSTNRQIIEASPLNSQVSNSVACRWP